MAYAKKTLFSWADKTIVVTGGTGTLGYALTAHFLANPARTPRKLVVFSRDELKQAQMRAEFQDARLRWLIGDVRSYDRLWRAFENVDVVIHAAAMKRIEACDHNVEEAVSTNIMGSLNVAKAAIDRFVDRVMLVSSDKACAASTLYGACKFVAERIFANANAYVQAGAPTHLSAVRYGNVLGSRGSVLHRWRGQVAEGKPIAITDPAATRFLLTKEQAVEFVLSSIELMRGGEVFVPKLPACSTADLVDALGYVAREIVGLQPNEKLHESLIGIDESPVFDLGDRYCIGRNEGTCVHPLCVSSDKTFRLPAEVLAKLIEKVQ